MVSSFIVSGLQKLVGIVTQAFVFGLLSWELKPKNYWPIMCIIVTGHHLSPFSSHAFFFVSVSAMFLFLHFYFSPLLLPLPSPPTSPPPLPPSLQCSGWQMFGWLACHNNCGAGCLRWLALAVLWVLHSQDRTGQDISWGYGWRKEKWGYEQGGQQKRGAKKKEF